MEPNQNQFPQQPLPPKDPTQGTTPGSTPASSSIPQASPQPAINQPPTAPVQQPQPPYQQPSQPVVPPVMPPAGAAPQPIQPNPFAQSQMQTPNPVQQPMSGVSPQPAFEQPPLPGEGTQEPGWKRFIKPAIIAIIVIAVLVGGYFAYMFISSKVQGAVTANTTNQVAKSTEGSTPEINTLKKFTLLAPETSKTQGMISAQGNGITQLTSSDGVCKIIYGTESQTQLPGTDIGDVMSQYLARLKQGLPHIVVSGPNKAAAVVLSGTDGKSYSLPTVNFTYTDPTEGGAANAVYSVSQLSNGSHAIVAVFCGGDTTKDPSVYTPQVNALEAAAMTIKVQV